MLIKQIKDDLNKGRHTMFRDTQLHQSKYINSPQTDVQVNTIPSKITGG